jgi:hypothetical protein
LGSLGLFYLVRETLWGLRTRDPKGSLKIVNKLVFISHLFFKGLSCFFTSTCEGAQGLFVQCLHVRICTDNSNSQNLSMGQQSHHYAIHAGRQLNVKEFCYLRTVRVTAAVCQWPLGRRQTIYLENLCIVLCFW